MKLLSLKKPTSFGLDIGKDNVKVVYIKSSKNKKLVTAYGRNNFKKGSIKEGEVVDFEELQRCIKELISEKITGTLSTDAVVTSIPVSYSYSRVFAMPKVSEKDLKDTVVLEAEQYIPTSISELYLSHEIIAQSDTQLEVLVVAAPRKIVDSYIKLFEMLDIKIASIETSMNSIVRVFRSKSGSHASSLVVDIGSHKSNLAVLDDTVRVTGYTSLGGNDITKAIADKLGISFQEANDIKISQGLLGGEHQNTISECVDTVMETILVEIRRMIDYYNKKHPSKDDISQVYMVGGSSYLPGLDSYMTDKLGISTLLCDPWEGLEFSKINPPDQSVNGIYAGAVGLALANFEKSYKIKNETTLDEADIDDLEDTDVEQDESDNQDNSVNTEEKKQEQDASSDLTKEPPLVTELKTGKERFK